MWINIKNVRLDLNLLGIDAAVKSSDDGNCVWDDDTWIVFNSQEDFNYYKLFGKFNYLGLDLICEM